MLIDIAEVYLYLCHHETFISHSASWYHIQPGNKRPPLSPPGPLVSGGLGVGAGGRAGLGALLAGGLGMGVPRPVPVAAVAYRPLINVDTLPRWDHPVPGKAVGT